MDIEDWLNGLGLGQYAAAFRENAIDVHLLPRLTGEDLKDMGIAAVGHRRILLDAIAALGGAAADAETCAAPAAAGERRQVSVLFADLVGFTRLSAALDAEEVRALLDAYFVLADGAVIDHGGTVDKHIGDCVMGVFGAPVAHGDDAERAVRAAIAIRDGARVIVDARGEPIAVHVGVASGEVVAAETGGSHQSYTVTGETVNLASRLADRAGAGEILVSAAMHDAIAQRFACERAGDLELKGFDGAMTAWRVTGARPAVEGTRPFVGRVAEKAQFQAALHSAGASGRGQTVYVRGEAGIGKSRLIEQFRALAREAGFGVLQGTVLDFGGDNGRAAIAELLRGLAGAALGLSAEPAAAALDEAMSAVALEAVDRATVLDLLDLDLPDALEPVFAAMDSQARARHLRRTIVRLVERASRRRPHMLVVEDVHWADAATLDAVSAIAEAVNECPALLVVSSRRDGDPARLRWELTGSRLTLDVAPLSREDAMALAASHLDTAASHVRSCIERAQGNPLFLDQLLHHAAAELSDTVPDTVRSLVQARMDRLPGEHKRALQTASVLGQAFTLEDLRQLMGAPAYDCGLLQQRHLVRRGEDGFTFTHALIRDAAYGTLLRGRRRELHRRAAELLAARDPALAAEHLALAGDPGAARACLEAADSLAARYRYEQALGLIGRGLAAATAGEDRIALELLYGDVLLLAGNADEARGVFTEALDAAEAPADLCRALLGRASACRITDDLDAALGDVERLLEIAGREGLLAEAARGEALRGNLLFPRGDIEGCRRAQERGLELAREAGSPELEAAALGGIGDMEYMRGRLRTAHNHFRDCVAMSARHDLRRIEAAYMPMQAVTQFWDGDIRGARDLALRAIEAARRIGHERAQMIGHHGAFFTCRHLMLLDEALEHAKQSLVLARRLKAPRFEAEGLAFVAQVAFDKGEPEAAREGYGQALKIGRESGMAYMGPILLGGCARVAETDPERERLVAEAEALLSGQSVSHNHYFFRSEMIDVCLGRGDAAGARHHAGALEAYASSEPTALSTYLVERGLALAAALEGEGVHEELTRLAAQASKLGDQIGLRAIEAALADKRAAV